MREIWRKGGIIRVPHSHVHACLKPCSHSHARGTQFILQCSKTDAFATRSLFFFFQRDVFVTCNADSLFPPDLTFSLTHPSPVKKEDSLSRSFALKRSFSQNFGGKFINFQFASSSFTSKSRFSKFSLQDNEAQNTEQSYTKGCVMNATCPVIDGITCQKPVSHYRYSLTEFCL